MPEEVTKPTIEYITPTKKTVPNPNPVSPKPTPTKPTPTKPIPTKTATPKPAPQNPTTLKTPLPETSQGPTKKVKPLYKYAGKETLSEIIKKSLPKQFIATPRFAGILGIIFLLVVILALVQFPFQKLLAGEADITIKIGYPLPFLELQILNPEAPPVRYLGLFVDIIIYLILSYAIDVIINVVINANIIKSERELLAKPKVYKNKSQTISDKITKKIFK